MVGVQTFCWPKNWTIPRVPRSANRLLRSCWQSVRRDRRSWSRHVSAVCGTRRRRPKRKIHVAIIVYRQRRQDPDNAYASVKPLLDALVEAGWLADDSSEYLSLDVREVEERDRAKQRTVVKWRPK